MRCVSRFTFISVSGLFAGLLILFAPYIQAAQAAFAEGESVFVAFPAGNIKDDAFIIGQVTRITPQGDYQIAVEDYVEGHDYGSSCVPISKHTQDQGLGDGWQIWQDTTKLDKQRLEYVVPANSVMKLDVGKHFFVERNNLYFVFGRWKSDAPMLTLERLERAEREAKSAGLDEMIAALALVKLHRQGFYGEYGRPLYAFETIAPLNVAVSAAVQVLQADPKLDGLWRAKTRDWKTINQSSRYYFLVDAIDKIARDASNQLYEEGVEDADPRVLASLKANLQKLKRSER